MGRSHLTDADKIEILQLIRQDGLHVTEVARRMRRSRKCIYEFIHRECAPSIELARAELQADVLGLSRHYRKRLRAEDAPLPEIRAALSDKTLGVLEGQPHVSSDGASRVQILIGMGPGTAVLIPPCDLPAAPAIPALPAKVE